MLLRRFIGGNEGVDNLWLALLRTTYPILYCTDGFIARSFLGYVDGEYTQLVYQGTSGITDPVEGVNYTVDPDNGRVLIHGVNAEAPDSNIWYNSNYGGNKYRMYWACNAVDPYGPSVDYSFYDSGYTYCHSGRWRKFDATYLQGRGFGEGSTIVWNEEPGGYLYGTNPDNYNFPYLRGACHVNGGSIQSRTVMYRSAETRHQDFGSGTRNPDNDFRTIYNTANGTAYASFAAMPLVEKRVVYYAWKEAGTNNGFTEMYVYDADGLGNTFSVQQAFTMGTGGVTQGVMSTGKIGVGVGNGTLAGGVPSSARIGVTFCLAGVMTSVQRADIARRIFIGQRIY